MANAEGRDDEQLPEEHQEPMNDVMHYVSQLILMGVYLHTNLERVSRIVNQLQTEFADFQLQVYLNHMITQYMCLSVMRVYNLKYNIIIAATGGNTAGFRTGRHIKSA